MDNIKGKRILLMIFRFYDYADRMKAELERMGAEVYIIFNPWPKESFSYSTNWLTTFFYRFRNPFYKNVFTNKVIQQIGTTKFDILFVVGGFCANGKLIKHLKKSNPAIVMRIFFWDSFCYWKISKQRKWFDKCFSFDPVDCQKYPDLIYQPNFYIGLHINSREFKYDVSHIGASHIFAYRRISILLQLKKNLDEKKMKSYLAVIEVRSSHSLKFKLLALTSWKWYKYYRLVKRYEKSDEVIMPRRIPYSDVVDIESNSRCIVDIPPSRQAGITIRALEAIAAGKKLITTNPYIKEQAFYNSKNIAILDPDNPKIDDDFIQVENEKVNIDYLRLDNWLKVVLC